MMFAFHLKRWFLHVLLLVFVSAVHAQPAVNTEVTGALLRLDDERAVPLPQQGGQWRVAYADSNKKVIGLTHSMALVHSDPQSLMPVLLLAYSQKPLAWRGSVCGVGSPHLFMVDWYGTQNGGKSQRCSGLFPVPSMGELQKSIIWQPMAESGFDFSALSAGNYVRATWRMQEHDGHALMVEALVRADRLGTSSEALLQGVRINQLSPAHEALQAWLKAAVGLTAQAYFNRGRDPLLALDADAIKQKVMAAAPPPERGDFRLEPVSGTSAGVVRTQTAAVSAASLPQALSPSRWAAPVNVETRPRAMPLTFASSSASAFEMGPLEMVRSPADGKVVYRGDLGSGESGYLIEHPNGLYSVLASTMDWDLRLGPEIGDKIAGGDYLATSPSLASPQQLILKWHLYHVDKAFPAGGLQAMLQAIRSGKQVSTRLVANLGAVLFSADESRPDLSLSVGGQDLPQDKLFSSVFLMPAGSHPVQVTSGKVFKDVNKGQILLSSRGVLNQVIGRKGNSGYALTMSNFGPEDLSSTQAVMAALRDAEASSSQANATLAAEPLETPARAALNTPTAMPSVTPPSAATSAAAPAQAQAEPDRDRQRLQAQAAQREQELEKLRQQLAQAEAARQAEALRVAEVQRLADARAAEAQRAQEQLRADKAREEQLLQQAQRQAQLQAQQAEAERQAVLRSGKRKALVIGNDLYRNVPRLDNARSDARAMGDSLRSLGFKVTMATDLTERGMKETLRNFKTAVEGGDEVVVFYAGHGVQLGSANYLLPVDIAGQSEEQVRDEAIQMQRILDDMQERRTGFMLMIVDACRDNPFKVAGRSIGGRGLAPTSAATGQMVIFSAGAGQQALDRLGPNDKEPNGLFTRLFLREMAKPGVPVDRVLRSVRSEVARLARTIGHEQTPALYDQSLGDFFLKP